MGYNWFRSATTSDLYDTGFFWACAIPSGSTYRRVRWSWGFSGDTSDTTSMDAVRSNYLVMGLATTIGNGGEFVPSPITNPGDASPPTQRWLWWESRQPVVTAVSHAAGVIAWRDSGVQEVPDVQVPVLATGIPGGDTLNLWASWQSVGGAWDTSGSASVWVATSVLYKTP